MHNPYGCHSEEPFDRLKATKNLFLDPSLAFRLRQSAFAFGFGGQVGSLRMTDEAAASG